MAEATKKTDTKKKKVAQKKATLHPDLKMLKIIDTSGAEWEILSTYNAEVMKLEIDKYTHPAWTKDSGYIMNKKGSAVSKFQDAFGDLFDDAAK